MNDYEPRSIQDEISRRMTRPQKQRRILLTTVIGTLGAILLVLQLIGVFVTLAMATANSQNIALNEQTLQEIESCTQPGGECFERAVKNRQDDLTLINEIVVAASACADKPAVQTPGEIERCVRDRLARED